jgi:hypothetical protein
MTDNHTEIMNIQTTCIINWSRKLLCSYVCAIVFMLCFVPIHAQNTTFGIKEKPIPAQQTTKQKPLFNVLKNPNLPTQKSTSSIGTNPFLKQSDMRNTIKTGSSGQPSGPFEYKITAIWTLDKTYKVMISGQILKRNQTVNNIKVIKITDTHVTVRKKNKTKRFMLGRSFYDFQI